MLMGPKEYQEHLKRLQKLVQGGGWTPPVHLSSESQAVWAEVVPLRVRSPEKMFALTVALEARDRLSHIRDELNGQRLTDETKRSGARHVHPLLRVEEKARADFLRAWEKLGLNHRDSLDTPAMRSIENPDAHSHYGVEIRH